MINKALIDKTKNYDEKINLIRKPISRYVLSRIFNYSDAQDIIQNTLIILAEKVNEFDSNKSFYSWAFEISKFQIKKYLTDKKRNPEDCMGDVDFQRVNKGCIDQDFRPINDQILESPYDLLIQKENRKITEQKIKLIKNSLSPKQKIAFAYFLKGLPRKHIRALMNMKKVALNATYRRMIENAKKILQQAYETEKLK